MLLSRRTDESVGSRQEVAEARQELRYPVFSRGGYHLHPSADRRPLGRRQIEEPQRAVLLVCAYVIAFQVQDRQCEGCIIILKYRNLSPFLWTEAGPYVGDQLLDQRVAIF